jgi:hypothetical protein
MTMGDRGFRIFFSQSVLQIRSDELIVAQIGCIDIRHAGLA